jgi:hypothetical protein
VDIATGVDALKKRDIPYTCPKSSSSSSICHGVGPLVDPFRSHVSRSLFKGLPWFLLPVGESVSLSWVIYYEEFYLHVVSSFSCIPVTCPKLNHIMSVMQLAVHSHYTY